MSVVRIDAGAGVELWEFAFSVGFFISVVFAADFERVLHLCGAFADSDAQDAAHSGLKGTMQDFCEFTFVAFAIQMGVRID